MISLLVILAMVLMMCIDGYLSKAFGWILDRITLFLHCAFTWVINACTSDFIIGEEMYNDNFVLSVLNFAREEIVTISILLLSLIAMWQLFKVFWGYAGLNNDIEEPWKIAIKIVIFATLIRSSYGLCKFIITGPVASMTTTIRQIETKVENRQIKQTDRSGTVAANTSFAIITNLKDYITSYGNSGLAFSIVKDIIILFIDYKMLMFILLFAQKYVNMIVYIVISPLAFAFGVSRSTSDILSSWIKLFAGGIAMQLFQITLLRVLNAYSSVIGAASRFDWSLVFVYFAVAMVTDKVEEILSEFGLSGGIRLHFGIGENTKIAGVMMLKRLTK
ncbi:MAG: hypothetical protein J6Y29_03140 [Clostridiales bacterium]|nr:hypothetical protein [Clostridiales bacterium]